MVTIKDVAKKAKVSIGTVDRVVHNRGRVSKKTTERVRKIIAESGYKPNLYARHLSLSKSYTIAVLMPKAEQDSGYWEKSVAGIKRAVNELKNHNVKMRLFQYDRYSAESFTIEAHALLTSKPDGIMVAPVIRKGIRDFFSAIPPKIPYVLFNTNVPDINAASLIGQDAYQSGVVCAKLMKMVVGSSGSIAVVLPLSDDYHITERADGFSHFFEDSGCTHVKTYSLQEQANEKNFDALMDNIFRDDADIQGVFVTNASTHFVARYLKEKSRQNKVFLVGYDLIEKNIEYLKEGWIDVLISQKAATQGYEGVYALYSEVVLQQQCERNILMPIEIVIKENLVYYT